MSYRDYVIAAYVVFAIVLLWDYVVPKLQVRAALRSARLQANRATKRTAARPDTMDLER